MTAGAAGSAADSRIRRWGLLLQGLVWTLVCLWAGEWLAKVAPLGLTGSVTGMLLLLLSLNWAALREPVAAAATLLLNHLSLFFIPISVGLMIHGELLSRYGGRLLIAVALSTWIGMAVTALLMRRLMSGPAASVLSSSRSTARGD
jgi:holin-like protein